MVLIFVFITLLRSQISEVFRDLAFCLRIKTERFAPRFVYFDPL